MMVPSSKLLFWTAAAAVPAAGLWGLLPSWGPGAAAVLAALAGVAAWDAIRSAAIWKGWTVRAPATQRLWKSRKNDVEWTLESPEPLARPLDIRMAPSLPDALETEAAERRVRMPADARAVRLAWPCRPLRRGCHRLDSLYVERASTLGLWLVRGRLAANAEIRVYPDFPREWRRMAVRFLDRDGFGAHARRLSGKGREFEQLREYQPGDSYEDIHWKASARRAHPVSKVFQIERTQEIYVAVDTSRLMARPSREEGATLLERAVSAAVLLGQAAVRQGDLFGLVGFGDRIDPFLPASSGAAAYRLALDALYAREPQPVSPDFAELFSSLRLKLRRRSLVVVLTCLDDPVLADAFLEGIGLVCRHHLVMVNALAPASVRPLFRRESVDGAEDLYDELAGHLQWRRLRGLRADLRRRNVELRVMDHERMCADLVSQYMDVKRRQRL